MFVTCCNYENVVHIIWKCSSTNNVVYILIGGGGTYYDRTVYPSSLLSAIKIQNPALDVWTPVHVVVIN